MKYLKQKYIGDKAFYKMLLSIALPIIIQNALMNFVSLLDNIMVGQLGTEQLSGVAIVNQLIFIFYLLVFGGLSGVGIYTAQFYGNKDDEGIRQTFRYKFWLGLIISVIAILVFLWFGDFFINKYLSGASDGGDLEATLVYGRQYLGIILFMIPAVALSQMYLSTLRECGQTVVPMVAGGVAVLTNLILDYVLIFGKFGFPEMGVAGAALGTVIARYVEFLIAVIWSFCNRDKHTYFKGIFSTLLVPRDKVFKFFVTGTPILINEGLWSLGIAMLGQAYSLRGLNVVAGQNIASTINNIFNIVFIAMGDAVAIIVGQYLGAGDMKKAKDADNKIIACAIFTSIIIGGIMFATSDLFPQLYNKSACIMNTGAICISYWLSYFLRMITVQKLNAAGPSDHRLISADSSSTPSISGATFARNCSTCCGHLPMYSSGLRMSLISSELSWNASSFISLSIRSHSSPFFILAVASIEHLRMTSCSSCLSPPRFTASIRRFSVAMNGRNSRRVFSTIFSLTWIPSVTF